jgi:hypothetical protein
VQVTKISEYKKARHQHAVFMSRANSSPNIQIPVLLIVEITMVEHH